jgi:hypothetical protein
MGESTCGESVEDSTTKKCFDTRGQKRALFTVRHTCASDGERMRPTSSFRKEGDELGFAFCEPGERAGYGSVSTQNRIERQRNCTELLLL